ncbi:LuxR C-terminal-related transcriptional regulator [Shewanella sp.]|uniref:LuxR C-terminal-related transcriptional regulator n=1 Tax=Shewanella sp. TaxID=50422 RepID=UPI003569ED66
MQSQFHIYVADDHPLYLEALAVGLEGTLSGVRISKADNYLDLFEGISECIDDLDLLLLDLSMPGSTGFSGLYFLRRQFPELPIVVISAQDDVSIRNECLSLGAAYLPKSTPPAAMYALVCDVLEGNFQRPKQSPPAHDAGYKKLDVLTPGQFKVLHLIAAGCANKEIAQRLNISEKTVKAHVTAIFSKLGVKNRTQAALLL